MTEQQQKWVADLARLRALLSSNERRFVQALSALGAYDTLTAEQARLLQQLAWRYRKQRGDERMPRPLGYKRTPREMRARRAGEKLG